MAELAAAGDRLAAMMEQRGESDSGTDAYVAMLGVVMDTYLNRVSVDARHPVFVPCTGYYQRLGTPNPDTIYRRAPIDETGIYRLTGERGSAAEVTLMAFQEPSMKSFAPFDLTKVTRVPGASFDLIYSAVRPEGHTGDWLPLEPGTASLWLRAVSDRWGEESEPRIAITRLDGASRQRLAPEKLEQTLATLAARAERTLEYGVRHADELTEGGFINRLKEIDYSQVGGMPLQSYHEGLFQLGEDEALLVEARMPQDCRLFSWALTDRMFVTLDWTNAHCSLNRAQAAIDADGVLRVIVSAKDPGSPNWLETCGYHSGVLQCRSSGSATAPQITARLVPLASVFDHLLVGTPRITPEERREQLRQRQAGMQMRHLW
jgi:hypothetical protein